MALGATQTVALHLSWSVDLARLASHRETGRSRKRCVETLGNFHIFDNDITSSQGLCVRPSVFPSAVRSSLTPLAFVTSTMPRKIRFAFWYMRRKICCWYVAVCAASVTRLTGCVTCVCVWLPAAVDPGCHLGRSVNHAW